MTTLEEASIVVERDGVTVHKSFEDEDFPVPAIAFEVVADRDDAVDVTIIDVVPPDVPAENIGFHPEYGAEFWSIQGSDIVFERRFEPGEEYTTVYGIRPEEVDDVESHLEDPVLETSPAGSLAGTSDVGGVDGDITVEPLDLDEGPVGPEVSEPTENDDYPEPGDHESEGQGTDPTAPPKGPDIDLATDVPLEGPTDPDDGGSAVADEGSLAGALAAEIRSGDVPDDEVRALRAALFDAEPDEAADSTEARIAHLQSAVSDLRAYTDALEAFVDDNGGATAAIGDLRDSVTDLEDAVETVEERTEDNADLTHQVGTDVDELDEEVQAVYEEVDDLHVDVEELEDDLETVRSEMGASEEVEGRLEDLEDDVAAIQRDLEDLAEMRDRMASVFGNMGASEDTE